MFYDPMKGDHGLPHNPYQACVVPRPIGWISSLNKKGIVNLAPFSQFNTLGAPFVMFSAGSHEVEGRPKDSVKNIEETGEFVCNMATHDLRDSVLLTGQIIDSEVDEMQAAGLTPAPSKTVKPPRVSEAPIHLECKHEDTIILSGNVFGTNTYLVIGRVSGVHISDHVIDKDGRVDLQKIKPLARLGYNDYAVVERVFEIAAHAQLPGPTKERLATEASNRDR